MEGKKKTASGTEKEAALAELDRVERELAELGPDPALEADKKSNAVLDKGKTRPLKEVKYPVAVSASELKKMEIPQIVWIVDRLLPVGVSMIGAPSKYYEEIEDLIQQGYFGMCNAVNGYDPENGVSFLHYASFWIRQSIHGYIEDCGKIVRLPRHFRGKLTKYKQFTAAMYAELNRRPTDQELCYYLDVGYEKLEELKRAAVLDKMGSLDVPVGENEESTLCDVVACPDCSENEILDKIQAEQLKTVIWTIVDDLPGIAPEVLRARFQEDLTLKETAARVGTTVEAVRQWQSKGLRELRKPSMSNELKPFIWDDYVYNQALRGNGAEHFNRTWTSSTERIALEEW